jgi:Ca2+/Na+ antiporter
MATMAGALAGKALPHLTGLQDAAAGAAAACEETYGIFPCSSSVAGSLMLIAGYGFVLLKGANLISDGSELLLLVMDPGLIGGLVLPILGALPDAAMICVSGLGGSLAEAQEDVAVGIGTLAGSTVMLLSIAWGGSLVVGRCDIENGRAVNKKLTKGWDSTETGVTSDGATRLNAYIMVASAFLYLFPQIPTFLGHGHSPLAALLGGIACMVGLAVYCIYQIVYPELQKRKKEAAHQKFVRERSIQMLGSLAKHAGCVMMDEEGNVRDEALRALFKKFDEDGNGTIDADELRKMCKVIVLGDDSLGKDDAQVAADMAYLIKELDSDGDGNITFDEMKTGLTKWLKEQKAETEAKAKQVSKPETRNPKPETRNPKPETRNPIPERRQSRRPRLGISCESPVTRSVRRVLTAAMPATDNSCDWGAAQNTHCRTRAHTLTTLSRNTIPRNRNHTRLRRRARRTRARRSCRTRRRRSSRTAARKTTMTMTRRRRRSRSRRSRS